MQAERSTIALYHHHPDLRTAWGDLEADIPAQQPDRAPQPPGFKATLLPFQQVRIAALPYLESPPYLRTTHCRKVFLGCASKRLESGGAGSLQMKWGALVSEFQNRILLQPPISRLINCLQNGQDGANACVALHGSPQTQSYSRVRLLLGHARYLNSLNQFCHMGSPTVAIMQWRNEIEAHTTGFTVSRSIVVHEARAERSTPTRPSYGMVNPARKESPT